MDKKPKLFWDSSGLIAAVLSPSDNSPGRVLLKLGEAGALDMRVSREVLQDCNRVIRRINPERVQQLAALVHQANIATTLDPDPETVERCIAMTGYEPDARVLAAAIECDADLYSNSRHRTLFAKSTDWSARYPPARNDTARIPRMGAGASEDLSGGRNLNRSTQQALITQYSSVTPIKTRSMSRLDAWKRCYPAKIILLSMASSRSVVRPCRAA